MPPEMGATSAEGRLRCCDTACGRHPPLTLGLVKHAFDPARTDNCHSCPFRSNRAQILSRNAAPYKPAAIRTRSQPIMVNALAEKSARWISGLALKRPLTLRAKEPLRLVKPVRMQVHVRSSVELPIAGSAEQSGAVKQSKKRGKKKISREVLRWLRAGEESRSAAQASAS